jgi:hypothetical protein
MFRALSCPSSGEQYKADNAYGVQHWPCCSRPVEKRWFGVYLLGLVSRLVEKRWFGVYLLGLVSRLVEKRWFGVHLLGLVSRRCCRFCTVLLMMGMMTP